MAGAGIFIGVFGLIFYLFILLLPVALLVALQVWLCKKGPRLGLILPSLSLALSLVMVFSIAAFSAVNGTVGGGGLRVTDENGNVIQEEVIPAQPEQKTEFASNTLIAVGLVFLVTNIPTAVFGGIWLHYKGRRDTAADLKKMRIEDLG